MPEINLYYKSIKYATLNFIYYFSYSKCALKQTQTNKKLKLNTHQKKNTLSFNGLTYYFEIDYLKTKKKKKIQTEKYC